MLEHLGKKAKAKYYLDNVYIFDVYYNRFFLKNLMLFSFLFVIVYFFSLFLVALPDLLGKASYNDFITFPHILTYYLYLFPRYINDTIAFSFLFSMNFTIGTFYARQEMLALVSSGVSSLRISLVSIVFALILSILLILANSFVFPFLMTKADNYAKKLNFIKSERYINNIQIRDTRGYLYFGQYFFADTQTFQDFLILKETENKHCQQFDTKKDLLNWENNNALSSDQSKKSLFTILRDLPNCFSFSWYLRGKKLVFDNATKIWTAYGYVEATFDPQSRRVAHMVTGEQKDLPQIKITPNEFKQENKNIESLTLSQSLYTLKQLQTHLEPTIEFLVSLWNSKLLRPLQILFLALIAVMMGRFFSQRHIFIFSFIYSFVIAFVFLVFVNIGYSLVKTHTIPFYGIFFGYFFGAMGIYILYKRQKI